MNLSICSKDSESACDLQKLRDSKRVLDLNFLLTAKLLFSVCVCVCVCVCVRMFVRICVLMCFITCSPCIVE